MKYLKLDIEIDSYQEFLSEEISLNDFLYAVCSSSDDPDNFDSGNREQIISRLLRNHDGEGAPPETDDFIITDEEYDFKNNSGKVTFNYDVGFYFGCPDISSSDSHSETVKFDINLDRNYLRLHFIDYEKPTTRDEF